MKFGDIFAGSPIVVNVEVEKYEMPDFDRNNPIERAVVFGDIDVILTALRQGIPPKSGYSSSERKNELLFLAISAKQDDVIRLLLCYGADYAKCFHIAAEYGDVDVVREAYGMAEEECDCPEAMYVAAARGHKDVVGFFY